MSSHYVGLLPVGRMIGPLGSFVGAMLAMRLVGENGSAPAVCLCVRVFVVGLARFLFRLFLACLLAYAYLIAGATYGVADPSQVWQIGLNRALEILVGAGSALIVTTLLWPRYAREEFAAAGRDALKTVRELFALQLYVRRTSAQANVEEIH